MRVDSLPSSFTQIGQPTQASGQDEFMRLFMAQLQNQDPLTPQDGADFVAQLAQFSSLEQLAQLNARLESLEAGQAAASRASLTDLVGRTVEARADSITLSEQGTPPLQVHLDGPAESVTVTVFDEAGTPIRTVELGATGAGDTPVAISPALPAGTYRIEVKATNGSGGEVSGFPKLKAVVDALEFSGGIAKFRLGGALLTPSDILSVVAD